MLADTAPLPELHAQDKPEAGRPAPGFGLWVAILAAGIAGNAGIALSPLLLSGMAQYLNYDDAQLGQLAAAASTGSSLVTIGALFFMDRKGWPLRLTAIAALCVYAAINLSIPALFDQPALLKAMIFIGGCCSGIVWSAAATGLTTVQGNERLTAVFYGAPYLTGLLVQPVMPLVFASWGLAAAYFGIAVACLLSLVVMRPFPRLALGTSHLPTDGTAERKPWLKASAPVAIVIAALLLQYIANSGLWVFFDRIGHVAGHTPQASANVVALGAGMALAGTVLATIFTTRLRPVPTILAASLAMALVTLGFLEAGNYLIFAGSVSLFNALITFITPFFFILLSRISASPGRAALGANICMMGGFTLGPLGVGYLAASGDFSSATLATAAAFVISGILAAAGSRRKGKG